MKNRTVGLLLLLAQLTAAQTTEKKYEPTQVQQLRLQVKQKDAAIASLLFRQAQDRLTEALNALNLEAQAVKKENRWPETTVFNQDTLQFSEAPPKEEKKP